MNYNIENLLDGRPVLADNGMTVELSAVSSEDLGNGYSRYTVSYTETNSTNVAIDQGSFDVYFAFGDEIIVERQYGFFGEVLPGEDFSRSRSFQKEVLTENTPVALGYAAFGSSAELMWHFDESNIQITDTGELPDTTPPSVTLSIPDETAGASADQEIQILFSEEVENFDLNDLTVSNGSLSNLSGSADEWSVLFTPDLSAQAAGLIELDITGVTDIAGNAGIQSQNIEVNISETIEQVISVIVDRGVLGADPVFIENIVQTKLLENGEVVSNKLAYSGVDYDYEQLSSIVTVVTRDGQFTQEFTDEITVSFPEYSEISYDEAIELVGSSKIGETLLVVAGADGNYVG